MNVIKMNTLTTASTRTVEQLQEELGITLLALHLAIGCQRPELNNEQVCELAQAQIRLAKIIKQKEDAAIKAGIVTPEQMSELQTFGLEKSE